MPASITPINQEVALAQAVSIRDDIDPSTRLRDPRLYVNRELSQLEFIQRVLMMTLDEQRRAKAVIVPASPILRMEQVMWTATGRSVGVNTSLVRRNVYMNSVGS